MPQITSAQRTFLTKSEPIIRAIMSERLDLITKALDLLKGDTELTKEQVRDTMSTVFSNLYAVDSDITALAKSCQNEGILPGDFDFDLAKGFAPGPDDDEKKKAAAKAKAEADAAEKAKADAAEKAKADAAKTEKGAGGIAPDLLAAIETVTPLLEQAAAQDTAPTEQIKRVNAFLSKVAATGGEVAKGMTAENVEKGFKHMTDARVAELKAAHSGLGNLLAIFETGKAADDTGADNTTGTQKGVATADPVLIETLKSLQTTIGTMGDRLSAVEHTRKSASGEDPDGTGGKKVDTEKGVVDWNGIL